eukprot:1969196-Alexandrium_andersonii.AAC.1
MAKTASGVSQGTFNADSDPARTRTRPWTWTRSGTQTKDYDSCPDYDSSSFLHHILLIIDIVHLHSWLWGDIRVRTRFREKTFEIAHAEAE